MEQFFGTAREIAHAGIAIVGQLAAAVALVATTLAAFGINVTDIQVLQGFGLSGGAAVLISKFIDSANNAYKVSKLPAPTALSPLVSFTSGTPVGGSIASSTPVVPAQVGQAPQA